MPITVVQRACESTQEVLKTQKEGCRLAVTFVVLSLTALPFVIMMLIMDGFYGQHSPEVEPGTPLAIRPFPRWSLANLSLAGILETKDELDLNSRVDLPFGTSLSRDGMFIGAPATWNAA